MRNILGLIVVLATLLAGCQDSTGQRWNQSPAIAAWNDRNSLRQPAYQHAYRQSLARVDDLPNFEPGQMVADGPYNDPYIEDPGPRANRRYLRRAYRQALARADDVDRFGRGQIASDTVDVEDAADPISWSSRSGHPRRAYRQALSSTNDDDEIFGKGKRGRASDPSRDNNLPPGFKIVTLPYGSLERSYLIYVPSKHQSGEPTPLVLVFHAGGGNAIGIARKTNMHRIAEQYGFIIAYPNGTGLRGERNLTWNAGASPPQGYAENSNIDDIGFIRAILQQIQKSYSIDQKRIYATGLSKGAMFSYRLACELSDQLAAVAPVAGSLTYKQCQPAQAVAILHIHGSNDQNVPFKGGRGTFTAVRSAGYPPTLEGLDLWRRHNKCAATPTKKIVADTEKVTYGGCENGREVAYYLVSGGGHGWPGATPNRKQQKRGVYISNQLHASEEIWQFFAAHPKP